MALKERIYGEYRGLRYSIGSRAPYSGVGWVIHWENSLPEECAGAFYDGCEDHPEGAYVWAESAVRKRIDKIWATVAEFEAELERSKPTALDLAWEMAGP